MLCAVHVHVGLEVELHWISESYDNQYLLYCHSPPSVLWACKLNIWSIVYCTMFPHFTSLLHFPGDFWNCELVCKLQKLHMDPHLDCDWALRIKIMKMMTQVLIKTRYNVSVSISNSRFQNIGLQWVDIMSIKITLIIAHLESQIMFIVLIYSLSLSLPKRRSLVTWSLARVNWITLPRTDCRS